MNIYSKEKVLSLAKKINDMDNSKEKRLKAILFISEKEIANTLETFNKTEKKENKDLILEVYKLGLDTAMLIYQIYCPVFIFKKIRNLSNSEVRELYNNSNNA